LNGDEDVEVDSGSDDGVAILPEVEYHERVTAFCEDYDQHHALCSVHNFPSYAKYVEQMQLFNKYFYIASSVRGGKGIFARVEIRAKTNMTKMGLTYNGRLCLSLLYAEDDNDTGVDFDRAAAGATLIGFKLVSPGAIMNDYDGNDAALNAELVYDGARVREGVDGKRVLPDAIVVHSKRAIDRNEEVIVWYGEGVLPGLLVKTKEAVQHPEIGEHDLHVF